MAFLVGFPNQEAYVLEAPVYINAFNSADLSNDEYVGLPLGAMILTDDLDGSGDGAVIMKYANVSFDGTDWKVLSKGAGIGVAP